MVIVNVIVEQNGFLSLEQTEVFAHEVCEGSARDKMKGLHFYLGACTQGKIDALHRKGLKSPTHTK